MLNSETQEIEEMFKHFSFAIIFEKYANGRLLVMRYYIYLNKTVENEPLQRSRSCFLFTTRYVECR